MSETPRTDAATDFTAPEMLRDCSRTLERELAAMTARAELAERQVRRLSKALENAAARLHTANTVGAFESGDDLADYLAEGYRQAHEAIIEAAKGVARPATEQEAADGR